MMEISPLHPCLPNCTIKKKNPQTMDEPVAPLFKNLFLVGWKTREDPTI